MLVVSDLTSTPYLYLYSSRGLVTSSMCGQGPDYSAIYNTAPSNSRKLILVVRRGLSKVAGNKDRRDIDTVGHYVGQFGLDLFIAQAETWSWTGGSA